MSLMFAKSCLPSITFLYLRILGMPVDSPVYIQSSTGAVAMSYVLIFSRVPLHSLFFGVLVPDLDKNVE